jgi:hypothetical protein
MAALGLSSDATFGSDYGFDPNLASIHGDFGGDDYSGINGDFGGDFGAEAATSASAVVKAAAAKRVKSARRASILHPNAGSDIKVERYTFSVNTPLVIGTASAIDMSNNPDVSIRPQRMTTNAPMVMFATISDVKVANASVTVGGGALDAFQFNPNAVDQTLDLPTLTPANRVRITGAYTGMVPPGFVVGSTVQFVVSFNGPATVMG